MNQTIKQTMHKYQDIENTYNYAFVGFPKGFGGIKKPFYGIIP